MNKTSPNSPPPHALSHLWHPTDYLRVLFKRRWVAVPGFLLVFLTGAIHLKSNVNLSVTEGATLKFIPDPAKYLPVVFTRFEGTECMNYSPLIYAFFAAGARGGGRRPAAHLARAWGTSSGASRRPGSSAA